MKFPGFSDFRKVPSVLGIIYTLLFAFVLGGCEKEEIEKFTKEKKKKPKVVHEEVKKDFMQQMTMPTPLWKEGFFEKLVEGETAEKDGYLLLDLGESWAPYIFSESVNAEGELLTNAYRSTYHALAQGEFPDDHHGARAERDKYLELYGIIPTLKVLRNRFEEAKKKRCIEKLDLEPLKNFDGFISYRNTQHAKSQIRRFRWLENRMGALQKKHVVKDVNDISRRDLSENDLKWRNEYFRMRPEVLAIKATQKRLKCEGFFEGKGRYTLGAMDWVTHEALAEFERRNRIYGWGFIGQETLELLQVDPLEVERRAVIRVLTERAIHAAQVIEDGSTSFRGDEAQTYKGSDGKEHPIPNLVKEIEERVVSAFGLETPSSTYAWLKTLGELPSEGNLTVAIVSPQLPEYYSEEMDLFVVIDRGDVWYEFPFNAEGKERAQPIRRRPKITVYVNYNDQKIPLARYGTTIGGWRSEFVDGTVMWKYKNSPTGRRMWHQIVASPVWLPPTSTPPRTLLYRTRKSEGPKYGVDYQTTGPGYASAYGLVAAYHKKYGRRADGTIKYFGDEGIRTHGSVDYMSIMRRHSHGCHRLHNHIAVRLMSFVLAHHEHRRVGQQRLAYRLPIEYEEESHVMAIAHGGYIFELKEPVQVTVLEGRVKGVQKEPITHAIPKFDKETGTYLTPEGIQVTVNRRGVMHPLPGQDLGGGGLMDGIELLAETGAGGLDGSVAAEEVSENSGVQEQNQPEEGNEKSEELVEKNSKGQMIKQQNMNERKTSAKSSKGEEHAAKKSTDEKPLDENSQEKKNNANTKLTRESSKKEILEKKTSAKSTKTKNNQPVDSESSEEPDSKRKPSTLEQKKPEAA